MAAQIQQLPHTAQRSIHRRYLGRRRFLDTQCVGEPGTTDLDLSCRALCAPSVRAPRSSPALPRYAATTSSVVSSVTAGEPQRRSPWVSVQPSRCKSPMAWPQHPRSPSRKSSGAMRAGSHPRYAHGPLEQSCVSVLSAGRREHRQVSASRILRVFALERANCLIGAETACRRSFAVGRWSGRMC